MDARTFLQKIIEEIPSRGLDNINIHFYCEDSENEYGIKNFKIKEITNNGDNDALFLVLSSSEN